jgi:hypothetical protein
MVDIPWCKIAVHIDKLPLPINYINLAEYYECIVVNNPFFDWPLDYNYPIKNLHLTEINITAYSFNQPLNKLPKSLKKIRIISTNFNQSLNNLPPMLDYISIIGNDFNQSLDNLPVHLKTLDIKSKNFNQSITNLPFGLQNLYLSITNKDYKSVEFDELPPNLEYIYLNLPLLNIRITQLQLLPIILSKLNYFTLYFHKLENIYEKKDIDKLINKAISNIDNVNILISDLDYKIKIEKV